MAAPDVPQPSGRPTVSVVVPFKGSAEEAAAVAASLGRLRLGPGDELVVVDNSAAGAAAAIARPGLRVVSGALESSSYYARNVGAAEAHGEWLLFIDADCRPSPDLVDRYFDVAPRERDGALAGVVRGVGDQEGTLVRFSRRFPAVEQDRLPTHLGRPFASTANLLVRAAAFRDVGGFAERVRSGGDIDFSWRLLALGWTLDERPTAVVEHRHRERFAEFVRPPVRYGAGQAWVLRRWPEVPQPGNDLRHLGRGVLGTVRWLARGRPDEALLRALLALYSGAHVVGRTLPNRPPRRGAAAGPSPSVAVVGRLPGDERVLEELRRSPGHVEALGRPLRMHQDAVRDLDLNYLEDDAPTTRLAAAAQLLARDPQALARWRALPARPAVGLLAAAPAALRLRRAGATRLRVLDPDARPLGDALAALTGLPAADGSV